MYLLVELLFQALSLEHSHWWFLFFCKDSIKIFLHSEDAATLSVVVDFWNLTLRNVFCQFQNWYMISYLSCPEQRSPGVNTLC